MNSSIARKGSTLVAVLFTAAISLGACSLEDSIGPSGTGGSAGGTGTGGSAGAGGSPGCANGSSISCNCTDGRSGSQTCWNNAYETCNCSGSPTCTNGLTIGCTCTDGRSGSQTCVNGNYGSCQCTGTVTTTTTSTATSTQTYTGGPTNWACRIVNSNQICCNPSFLGNAAQASLLVYEGNSGMDGQVATSGTNGYCWTASYSGVIGFSYGPNYCRGLPSTSVTNANKSDCWAQYGSFVGSFAGTDRSIVYTGGNGSYGMRVNCNGSYCTPAGNM